MRKDNIKDNPVSDDKSSESIAERDPAPNTEIERKKQLKNLIDGYPPAVRSELYELLELDE